MKQFELENIIDYSKDAWELLIAPDEWADSPREWGNLGKICVPTRCKYFKDESGLADSLDWYNSKADKKTLEKLGYIVFPLSVYDHSGVSVYIGGKCDAWDSGQVGWYIVNKKDACEWYNAKRINKKLLEKIENFAEKEVKTFNRYLNGEIYNYTLIHNGEEVDSCGGFYDNDSYLGFIDDIYEQLPDEFINAFTVEQAKQLATWK